MMLTGLARQTARRSSVLRTVAARAQSTQVEGASSSGGPLGTDGRHEIWREDIYDHDNEPK